MLDILSDSCGMSMVERDSLGMWGLSRLSVTLEQEQSMRQKQDFYLNYGRALRVIREDIPRFFKQAPDTSILADNVTFVDNIGPRIGLGASAVEGKKAYSQHMWLLRFHSSLIFSRCEVSIQRVWERDSRTVVVRWSLRCFPRILDNVMGTMVNLDGLSEYHFNDAGFVQMHKVDVINWDDARKKKPAAQQLFRSLSTAGC